MRPIDADPDSKALNDAECVEFLIESVISKDSSHETNLLKYLGISTDLFFEYEIYNSHRRSMVD